MVTALNKIDRLDRSDPYIAARLEDNLRELPNAVAVSALTGEGLDLLLSRLDEVLYREMIPVDLLIPYSRGELVALAHTHGFVESEDHTPQGTHLQGRVPFQLAGRYADFRYEASPKTNETS